MKEKNHWNLKDKLMPKKRWDGVNKAIIWGNATTNKCTITITEPYLS